MPELIAGGNYLGVYIKGQTRSTEAKAENSQSRILEIEKQCSKKSEPQSSSILPDTRDIV